MQSILEYQPWDKAGDSTIKPTNVVCDLGALLDQHRTMSVSSSIHLRTISKARQHIRKDACAKAVNALVTTMVFCFNTSCTPSGSSELSRPYGEMPHLLHPKYGTLNLALREAWSVGIFKRDMKTALFSENSYTSTLKYNVFILAL